MTSFKYVASIALTDSKFESDGEKVTVNFPSYEQAVKALKIIRVEIREENMPIEPIDQTTPFRK
jgi:hypothetical protein